MKLSEDEKVLLGMTKVSDKFQVRIPADARKFLGVRVGDKILFWKEGDRVYIEVVK